MLIELQACYLDLIVQRIDAAGHGALLVKSAANVGVIYVTETAETTRSVMAVAFNFQDRGVTFGIDFRDGRGAIGRQYTFAGGVDEFLAEFERILLGNRLTDKRRAA